MSPRIYMTALLSFMFGIQTAGKFAKFANFRPAKGQQYVWLFINICLHLHIIYLTKYALRLVPTIFYTCTWCKFSSSLMMTKFWMPFLFKILCKNVSYVTVRKANARRVWGWLFWIGRVKKSWMKLLFFVVFFCRPIGVVSTPLLLVSHMWLWRDLRIRTSVLQKETDELPAYPTVFLLLFGDLRSYGGDEASIQIL